MKIINNCILFLVAAALTGCATSPTARWTPIAFDANEYSIFDTTGTGVLRGQVFAKTKGGNIKKGAGNNVYLMPNTKFTRQLYDNSLVLGLQKSEEPDSRYFTYHQVKLTDGEGRFEFQNLPEGNYRLISDITWEVVNVPEPRAQKGDTLGTLGNILDAMKGPTSTQGGRVQGFFEVKNGKVTDAMLTL